MKRVKDVVAILRSNDRMLLDEEGYLLPQRQLCLAIVTSRTTLSEALKQARRKGIVRRTRRGDMVAKPRPMGIKLSEEDLAELIAIRRVLERNAARRAARKFNRGDQLTVRAREAFEICMAEMEAAETQATTANDERGKAVAYDRQLNADKKFHNLIFRLAYTGEERNITHQVFGWIRSEILNHVSRNRQGLALLTTYRKDTFEQHRKLYEAIKRGDARSAASAADEHMKYVRKSFEKLKHLKGASVSTGRERGRL